MGRAAFATSGVSAQHLTLRWSRQKTGRDPKERPRPRSLAFQSPNLESSLWLLGQTKFAHGEGGNQK